MPEEHSTSTVQRLAAVGASIAAGWLVHKIIDAVWRRAVGHPTPAPDDDERSLTEVVLATAITGALVALSRGLARRGAARLLPAGSTHAGGTGDADSTEGAREH